MNKLFLWVICNLLMLLSCSSSEDSVSLPEPVEDSLHEWTSENLIQTVEAENGILNKVRVESSQVGYSGTGYLTGFWDNQASVSITVEAPEKAMYRLKINYFCEGTNSHNIVISDVNKESTMVSFPASNGFETLDMGKYLLKKGTNTITFQAGWGNVFIDKFTLYTAPLNVYNIAPTLVDKAANKKATELYQYMINNFGKKIISGFLERKPIDGVSDRSPMLYGWDFASYTEGYPWHWGNGQHVFGAEDNGSVQNAIDWYVATGQKGIVTFHWHWASPSGGTPGVNTFYTDNTRFKVSVAVKENTEENRLIIRDIDAIAVQLKRLEAAGVPVLWRPLHEAGGGWFWWGAEGPEACMKLYTILYNRLVDHHQIHNLIWVWSSYEREWYPGNDKVDIIGYDSYPADYNVGVQSFMFNSLYKLTEGKKIIAMTENGPIPDPDACIEQDAPWALFMAWNELLYKQNTSKHIYDVYHNESVITLMP